MRSDDPLEAAHRVAEDAIVAEEAFDYLDGPVTRIAGPRSQACSRTTSSRNGSWSTRRRSPDGIRTLAAY